MKKINGKKRFWIGLVLFSFGLVFMFLPQLLHVEEYHMASHAIIVFGALCVLFGFKYLLPNRKGRKEESV
ncbi:MAG: hypothetical protein GXY64_10425 [Bacteroidales bacterium]|mgnify:CR=1 FL=1|nr:hypothetical protein [Bacteroidales bacterium]